MKCPNCNAETKESICPFCGSEIPKPTSKKSGCPKCGGQNVIFRRESKRSRSKSTSYRTVGLCQDCGYTWVAGGSSGSSSKPWWVWLLIICFWPIPLSIWFWKTNKINLPNKTKGIILGVFWVFTLIISAVLGSTSTETKSTEVADSIEADSQSDELNAYIKVVGKQNGNKAGFDIKTNLPDESELMFTLSNGDYNQDTGFRASAKTTVKGGEASIEGFTNDGNALVGNFDLVISTSLPSIQSDNVRAVIGQNGEKLTGDIVVEEESTKRVQAHYTVSIVNGSVIASPSTDYQYTTFYEGDYSEFDAIGNDVTEENGIDETEDAEASNEVGTETKAYATTDVRIRQQPNTDCEVLGKAQSGNEVVVLGEEGEWSHINFNGIDGYIKSEFLTTNAPSQTQESVAVAEPAQNVTADAPAVAAPVVPDPAAATASTGGGEWGNTQLRADKVVYKTPTGKKYHYDPECAGPNATPINLSDAESRFDPCGTCVLQ